MSQLADIILIKQPEVYAALASFAGVRPSSWHRGRVDTLTIRKRDQEAPVAGKLKAAL